MHRKYSTAVVVALCMSFLSGCNYSDDKKMADIPRIEENAKKETSSSTVSADKISSEQDKSSDETDLTDLIMESNDSVIIPEPTDEKMKDRNTGESTMNTDIPTVDTDSAQQIENSKKNTDTSALADHAELDGKITMIVSANADGNISFTITNNSDFDIDMGEEFTLQKIVDGTWQDIPLAVGYTDRLIVVLPKENRSFQYNLGSLISLEKGTSYRIVKTVSAGQINYMVTADFEI